MFDMCVCVYAHVNACSCILWLSVCNGCGQELHIRQCIAHTQLLWHVWCVCVCVYAHVTGLCV